VLLSYHHQKALISQQNIFGSCPLFLHLHYSADVGLWMKWHCPYQPMIRLSLLHPLHILQRVRIKNNTNGNLWFQMDTKNHERLKILSYHRFLKMPWTKYVEITTNKTFFFIVYFYYWCLFQFTAVTQQETLNNITLFPQPAQQYHRKHKWVTLHHTHPCCDHLA
jgi:hypothetical protein